MSKTKPGLTIAIPAFNEEANIENIIKKLLLQKQKNYELKEIIIYSDASTDKTNEMVKTLSDKYPLVKLIIGKERKGKYFRINELFQINTSSIILIIDADVGIVGNNFIEELVNTLESGAGAQMVAAHNVLLPPKNFIGKIIYANFMIWEHIRLNLPNNDSALNFLGSATAYKKSFSKTVRIPDDLLDPHLFIYLKAKKIKGFRYCMDAIVLQRAISTLADLNKLLSRTIGKQDKYLENTFGRDFKNAYRIPFQYKLIGFLKAFISQPLYTMLAVILNIYIIKIKPPQNINKTPVWDIVHSTKKPIITN